ncbi:MAG: transposase [Treponema sp.]|nr:transposase [Treponema sp.]
MQHERRGSLSSWAGEVVREIPVTDKNIEWDRIIRFTGCKTSRDCPDELRLIKSTDPKTGKSIEILTNMKGHSAKFIAGLYKKRWEVELFFKASKHSEIMQMLCVSYYFSLCLLSSSS